MRKFLLGVLFFGVSLFDADCSLAQTTPRAPTLTGIDVLETTNFGALRRLKGFRPTLRIGLLTNVSGIDRSGRRTIDVLTRDAETEIPGLKTVMLFSPEHGLFGDVDTAHEDGGKDYTIANSVDPATRLPIVSLFGNTDAERYPKEDQLRQLDLVIIDLQDVGIRFYTYETLTGYFLEVAAKTNTTVMVLDRPNPVRGDVIQGPTSASRASYLNLMPIPLRHGLTLGELALQYRLMKHLHTHLSVVKMKNWHRDEWFDETSLPWRNPSPNLRDMDSLVLYGGIGMVETANVSVGRGTDTPFTVVGAPWINSEEVVKALRVSRLAGLAIEPFDFTPEKPFKFSGELCHGVRIRVIDRNVVNSPALGAAVADTLHSLYPDKFRLQDIDPLKVDDGFNGAIEEHRPLREMTARWAIEDERFRRERSVILAY